MVHRKQVKKRTKQPPLPTPSRHTVPQPSTSPSPPGFLQTMKEGFGFGLGSSIAHNTISSLFGNSTTKPDPLEPLEPKYSLIDLYSKCLDKGQDNCEFLLKKIDFQNENINNQYTLTQLYNECQNSINQDCNFLSKPN